MVPLCCGHPANCESCSFPCQPSDHIGIKECVARRPSSKAEDSGFHASSHAHTNTQRLRETDQVQTQNGPRATAPCPRSSYQHALSKYPEMREVAKQLEAHLVLKSVLTLPGWNPAAPDREKGNRSHPKNRWYHGSRCLHTAAVGPPARIVPSRMYWQDHCISHASSLKREKADAMLSKGTADVQARERARERKQFAQFTKLAGNLLRRACARDHLLIATIR